jgi:branched-chain amino acid transport system permease protein
VDVFLQQCINGLMLGGTYALLAIGYTLIFGVLNLLHLAHGEVFMIGAFAGLTIVLLAKLPIWAAMIAAMVGAGVVGIIVELVAFRPLQRKGLHITPLITTLAVALILQDIALKLFGGEQTGFPETIRVTNFLIGPVQISTLQLFIIGSSVVLMVLLYLFVEKTKLGKAMRAMAESPQTARLLGINVDSVTLVTFGIASALAGAAGVLVGLAYNAITPFMGVQMGLKGMVVMMLGGTGNVIGAMLGGLILGEIEVLSVAYLSSSYRDAFAFGILILIILFRPTGLMGSRLQAGR